MLYGMEKDFSFGEGGGTQWLRTNKLDLHRVCLIGVSFSEMERENWFNPQKT